MDGSTLEPNAGLGEKIQNRRFAGCFAANGRGARYAHQNGVVHRDIKPANIMLHKGITVKVADFGIAKNMSTEYDTMAGMIMGTPSYMSPEQIDDSRWMAGPISFPWPWWRTNF